MDGFALSGRALREEERVQDEWSGVLLTTEHWADVDITGQIRTSREAEGRHDCGVLGMKLRFARLSKMEAFEAQTLWSSPWMDGRGYIYIATQPCYHH